MKLLMKWLAGASHLVGLEDIIPRLGSNTFCLDPGLGFVFLFVWFCFFKIYLFLEREGRREGEKHRCAGYITWLPVTGP